MRKQDVFALYVKTKNFHWHMNGRHFRDFHLMLDDQSDQLFAMIDPVAERTRKLGGTVRNSPVRNLVLNRTAFVRRSEHTIEPSGASSK